MAGTKLYLKLKVLHSPVVPQLQCREVLEYHLYLWVVMEISLSFTQTVRACHQPHTDSISPPHWALSQESLTQPRVILSRDTFAFWGCGGQAHMDCIAKHDVLLLFLSTVALPSSLAVAARVTQHTATVRKSIPGVRGRCGRHGECLSQCLSLLKEADRQYI